MLRSYNKTPKASKSIFKKWDGAHHPAPYGQHIPDMVAQL
jgi:hypothetical protein